jgi:hypothetical protein
MLTSAQKPFYKMPFPYKLYIKGLQREALNTVQISKIEVFVEDLLFCYEPYFSTNIKTFNRKNLIINV